MPELPEIHTIVEDLRNKVLGAEIVEVYYTVEGQKLISKSGQNLTNILLGEKIHFVKRKAKYLILGFSSGQVLVFHLKLTGRILVRDVSHPEDEFTRLVMRLLDNREIRFTDRNGYGEVVIAKNIEEIGSDLAPDPFETNELAFYLTVHSSRSPTIKEALLDQRTVSGVGNIYADEALFLAGLNPFRSPKALPKNEFVKLFNSLKKVLEESIKHRGTTIDSYRDTDGRPGNHQFHLLVYGRAGKPCKKCATKIEYTEIAGRRTHFCPSCQPKEQLSLF